MSPDEVSPNQDGNALRSNKLKNDFFGCCTTYFPKNAIGGAIEPSLRYIQWAFHSPRLNKVNTKVSHFFGPRLQSVFVATYFNNNHYNFTTDALIAAASCDNTHLRRDYNYESTSTRLLFDRRWTPVRPRYDHSTICITVCYSLLHCGLNN